MASVRSTFITISLVATIAMAVLFNLSMAASYTVGGPNGGWDAATDLQTWATSKTFQVGDNLIFQYAPSHDVVEVPQTDYTSCQATTPIQSYTGGATVVPLTSSGDRYFICGTPGHCSGGMKLQVNVLATSPAPAAATPEESPASSPPASEDSPLLPPASSSPSDLPFPTADSPAESPEMSPLGSSIPVFGSSPAYSPASVSFPTGTSALTPPVATSSAGRNGFWVGGVSAGFCSLAMIAMLL
ncbi:unnamed protein product [Linum tenue]|uniref:Phytocyanin domain-containing protein n=1 Tax=Linum tenue TaxID=586396 RepID=A0AAV0QZ14_9ROSI|nr:unnamed protein product [Linum tenue]CAI0550470.1 unnamed protein product [Linum tenue]